MHATRTIVTFQSSAFNTTERRPYFINDGCYGDDLARWMIGELDARGIPTEPEPGQEDFGWYLTYRPGKTAHLVVLAHRPGDHKEPPVWVGWIEREAGLFASLIGGRHRGIELSATQVIHDVLSRAPAVGHVRWHRKREFDAGNEGVAATRPDAA